MFARRSPFLAAFVAAVGLALPAQASAGRVVRVPTYQAWAIWQVPAYAGPAGAEVAQWVGVQFDDLCQAGIASTMLPDHQVQTSLIAQDWPAPFAAAPGPRAGDLIFALVGKVGTVNEARVVDLTTGQTLSVPCSSEGGAGWPLAEWQTEVNAGAPTLVPVGGTRWLEQGYTAQGRPRVTVTRWGRPT